MRIVAGKYRGKILKSPDGDSTRPTADRAREMLFNMLDSLLLKSSRHWADLTVLDAFAGTGALGLEAVSRGAGAVTFMEKDVKAMAVLRQNAAIALKDGVPVRFFSDVLTPPAEKTACGLVLMDPPYGKNLVPPALSVLREKGWIDGETVCVIETEKNETPDFPDGFCVFNDRCCGKAKMWFLICRQ